MKCRTYEEVEIREEGEDLIGAKFKVFAGGSGGADGRDVKLCHDCAYERRR